MSDKIQIDLTLPLLNNGTPIIGGIDKDGQNICLTVRDAFVAGIIKLPADKTAELSIVERQKFGYIAGKVANAQRIISLPKEDVLQIKGFAETLFTSPFEVAALEDTFNNILGIDTYSYDGYEEVSSPAVLNDEEKIEGV